MPITDIVFTDGDNPQAVQGGMQSGVNYAILAEQAAGGTLIGMSCTVPGVLPAEPNAAGSNYPGAHWKRWDGTVAAGVPNLGVDDGILENCLANYAPILYGVPNARRLCVYVGNDGNYYAAGPDDGSVVGAAMQQGLNVQLRLALDHEIC